MKKIAILLSVLMVFSSFCVFAEEEAAEAVAAFSLTAEAVEEDIVVTVVLDTPKDVAGMDFALTFDPAVFTGSTEVKKGEFAKSFILSASLAEEEGVYLVSAAKAEPSVEEEPVEVLSFTLTTKEDAVAGDTKITLTEANLAVGLPAKGVAVADAEAVIAIEEGAATDTEGKTEEGTDPVEGEITEPAEGEVTEEPVVLPFTDVTEEWMVEPITELYAKGAVNGKTETTFDPNGEVTRAEFAKMMVLAYDLAAEENVELPFTDVSEEDWFAPYVKTAVSVGIINGTSETTFSPEDSITREQIAAILYRFAEKIGVDVSVGENTNILSYEDAAEISEYAVSAMQWVVGAGVISGTTEATLSPAAPATRAQTAAILVRANPYTE